MKTAGNIKELKQYLNKERERGKSIGLVPTMGALHAGHISLVRKCVAENDICVVSIFVNPTQFNDKKDLETYPRTPEQDYAMLESAGCAYVFSPDEKEMYPEEDTRIFDFGRVAEVMEGKYRPGHFNGVGQIVSKLFDIVEPGKAYFGEKDFQQIAVIRKMVRILNQQVEIISCPILREKDGLALSSRNTRLTPEQRQKAPLIARVLKESTNFAVKNSVRETIDFVIQAINKEAEMKVEYYEIVDGETLEPIINWSDSINPVGCITVFCGQVRLIDNIHYNIF
ncbi:pantoate--beta-alanine ligase [Massilibacteroides vaginae]|uniref:pantoate--beta-alanine ligase n=1 Tax=Massilibacteroides vaginae TaxID=1673718 RepID=UPI000A1C8262|nr:pantoate--beta-alanine ligase [Massilibacteroides vaginae]